MRRRGRPGTGDDLAVTRLDFPAGTYADARPDGQYAVLNVDGAGAWMSIPAAALPIPDDARPLYVRIPRTGAFKFAGQASQGRQTIEYRADVIPHWQPRDVEACGVNAVIYDDAGNLVINCHPVNYGSQGLRYVDVATGQLVSGDHTLGSDFGLAEWTDLGDGLYVGQCNLTPGCALWDGTHNRMIDAGDSFFIRAQRVGPDVALAMTKHQGAVCLWTTLDELRACPIITAPPIVYPVLPDFTHAVSVAPFKDLQGTSGADSEVVIDGAVSVAPRPAWAGFDLNGGSTAIDRLSLLGRLVGIFAEDYGPRGIDAARKKADALHCRVAWLHDGNDPAPIPVDWLKPWDQVWVREYREVGESLEQARREWSAAREAALLTHCADLGLVPMYYGPFSDQETVEIIAAGLDPVNTNPRWKVIAPFEYDRTNGITGRPALQEMFTRTLRASVLGSPVFVPQWPYPPVPASSTAGSLLMAEIKGVLNYFGSKPLTDGKVALFADKAHSLVFSAHGDTRPSNAIGTWEQWKLAGQVSTAWDFKDYFNWVAVDVSGLA